MSHGTFYTVVNCRVDGRVQRPVLDFLQNWFHVQHVDSITEAGPVRVLAHGEPVWQVESILAGVRISLEKHGSRGVAVVAHYDCAGNPLPNEQQISQLERALEFLRDRGLQVPLLGLWLGEDWKDVPVVEK